MSEDKSDNFYNAEIRKRAKEIILRVCRDLDLDFTKSENFKIIETEADEIEFHFTCSDVEGRAAIQYSPQPYIENLLQRFKEVQNSRAKLKENKIIPPGYLEEWTDRYVYDIARILIHIFQYESFLFVYNQPKLAMNLFGFLPSLFLERESNDYLLRSDLERKNQINKILDDVFNEGWKKVILELEKQFLAELSAPQFVFYEIYNKALKHWQDAKAFYKKNKNFPNVLELIKKAFPMLDADLIDKFPLRGESEPAPLAFESVSRFLNIPPEKGANETSRKRFLAESKAQRQLATDQQIKDAYKKYVLSWAGYYQNQERWKRMALDFINKTVRK